MHVQLESCQSTLSIYIWHRAYRPQTNRAKDMQAGAPQLVFSEHFSCKCYTGLVSVFWYYDQLMPIIYFMNWPTFGVLLPLLDGGSRHHMM